MRRGVETLAATTVLLAALAAACCGDGDASGPAPELQLTVVTGAQPYVGDTIRVRAELLDAGGAFAIYAFDVTDPAGAAASFEQGDSKTISFVAKLPGTYEIACLADVEGHGQRHADAELTVAEVDALELTARIFPPPELGLPPLDQTLHVAGVDLQHDIQLPQFDEVSISAVDGGAGVPGFVRLVRDVADPLPRQLYLADGAGSLQLAGTFHAVYIPDGDTLAPMIKRSVSAASGATIDFDFTGDAGGAVSGTVLDAAGTPLEAALVALRAVDPLTEVAVPSTVASSDAGGSFNLLTRDGAGTMTVAPPSGRGLPVAVVEHVDINAATRQGSWSFRYAAVSTHQVSATISDGASAPVAAAEVTLSTEVEAGELTLPGGSKLDAVGRFEIALVTDSAGQLVDPADPGATTFALPAGSYTIKVQPPAGSASRAVVVRQIDAPTDLALVLAPKAAIEGVVRDPDGNPLQALVEARGPFGVRSVLSSADSGQFSVPVDADVDYTVVVHPPAGVDLAAVTREVTNVSGTHQLNDVQLPRAIRVSGRLLTIGGLGVADALVRVWCSDERCVHRGTLLEEARSGADGTFTLRVPTSGL